jgi:hypothetical protein
MQFVPGSWTDDAVSFVSVEAGRGIHAGALQVGQDALSTATRLVILVPDDGVDSIELAEEVRRLDPDGRMRVLFLALAPGDHDDEPWLHRLLVTLTSLTRGGRPGVEWQVAKTRSWQEAVQAVHRAQDALMCLRGRNPLARRDRATRLAEELARVLDTTVVEVQGLRLGGRPSQLHWVRSLMGVVPFIIVAGFLVVQVRIEQVLAGPSWEHQALQALVLAVEVSLIWLWETRMM